MATVTPTASSDNCCSCCLIVLIMLMLALVVFTVAVRLKISNSKKKAKVNYQRKYAAPEKMEIRLEKAPEIIGAEFEKYVLDKFYEKDFAIVEMTHKFAKPGDRYVESDLNPDFVFRHLISGDVFAVEAKYRSSLNKDGMLEWSNKEQLDRYNKFARERGIPVYVVIGIGGTPSFPREFVCIPLEDARYPALYPSVYKKYTRDMFKDFDWFNGELN